MNGLQIDWASITADADGAKRLKAGTIVSRKADGKVQPRSYTQTLTGVSVTSKWPRRPRWRTATASASRSPSRAPTWPSQRREDHRDGTRRRHDHAAATGCERQRDRHHPGLRVATEMIETDATNTNLAEALTGYGSIVGGVFYENLLPDATGGLAQGAAQRLQERARQRRLHVQVPPVRRQPRRLVSAAHVARFLSRQSISSSRETCLMLFSFIAALLQLGPDKAFRLINAARPAASYLYATILPERPMMTL